MTQHARDPLTQGVALGWHVSPRWGLPTLRERHGWGHLFLMIALVIVAAGCGKPNPADRPLRPDQIFEMKKLYGQHCAGCHGANGKLGPAPPLNDTLFRTIISLEELRTVIAAGRPGTLMPAFGKAAGGPLSPEQIEVMVFEIRGLSYRLADKTDGRGKIVELTPGDPYIPPPLWPPPQPPPGLVPSYVAPPDAKAGSWQAGEKVFQMACAGCHGQDGRGASTGGPVNDPVFLSLISPQALRRLIIAGRPDRAMPTYAEVTRRPPGFQPLTDQQIADLEALLAHWRLDETVKTR